MYTHSIQYKTAGTPAAQAKGALVMLHGRGGNAANIINLAQELDAEELAIYAPEAANDSWYPYSFMAPDSENQPALESALDVIGQLVEKIKADGIPANRIYLMGFSQGACLTLEYVARNAQAYGGAIAFTGGLVGEELVTERYQGNFAGTPVLITTGNPDPHVPLHRVEESVELLKRLGAQVTLKVYPGRPHTITMPEIELANELLSRQSA
jgi:phospholipase/carboxylesterase